MHEKRLGSIILLTFFISILYLRSLNTFFVLFLDVIEGLFYFSWLLWDWKLPNKASKKKIWRSGNVKTIEIDHLWYRGRVNFKQKEVESCNWFWQHLSSFVRLQWHENGWKGELIGIKIEQQIFCFQGFLFWFTIRPLNWMQ